MATSEAQKRANKKWQRSNAKNYILQCYKTTDADIIERLDRAKEEEGRATYIKRLIREDIK